MTRRKRMALAAVTSVVATAGVWAGAAYTNGGASGVRAGQGVGMYSDPSTANQAATFTINKLMVSCGVAAENIAGVGRFEMLMYSTRIRRYRVDSASNEITARGEMRSITREGGAVVEDVRHPFIAHALDLDGGEGQPRRDRFEVHFRTSFWSSGNPMCTPSDRYAGLCRIGGRLFAGNVNVDSGRRDDDDDGGA
jgi:hypothetical protein